MGMQNDNVPVLIFITSTSMSVCQANFNALGLMFFFL